MLLELYPPDSSSLASTAFNVHLAFSDLQHGLSTPLAWTAQLSTLLHSELDLPTQQHMLDRAVGVGALLEGVRVEILKDEASDELGVRVHCQFADFTSVDWCIPAADCGSEEARRFVCALEAILGDIQAMRAEEEKFKMAVELEEQRREVRHTTRHQHTQSMEPVSVGRKWAHKRQKSFLQSIVSAVGSMMSQRSSPATQPILPTAYPNDYPFPLSPSPSPPLSPPYTSSPNPSRSGTPSPDPSSCSSVANQHGHAPHTYAYGSQHAAPLPPNPWSPPSRSPIPLSPQSVHSWGSLSFSTQHQIRLEGHRRRITAAMVDTYRRFILGALVFGFAKEVGLVSDNSLRLPGSGHTSGSQTLAGSPLSEGTIVPDAMTSSTEVLPRPSDVTPTQPPSPYTGPARASSNAPTTYNYRLWVLRSMLRSMEAEVREIVESCEASVKEDYLRAQAQAQDEEDEVDISDGNIDVSGLDVPPRSATTSVFPSPASPAVPSFGAKHKVSFDSSKSMKSDGGSPKKGEKVVEKKRSRGKLVKKKSLVWRGSSASEGEGESTKGKEKGGVLGIIGSWGRSKTNVSTPSVISPIVEDDSEALSQQPTFSSTASPALFFGARRCCCRRGQGSRYS
ncbi:hypothetical protein DFP72DRAFT_499068 [Ephemerocybe angulata]|uniref:Uncharacterized protein n=1 Tax=Ephemerocybe angulata TaxID=980116 RepID=A0A8H6M3R2_9AGAR|nr:hypothetical protein DFP72DRAFT_499068 [Tulosesus angulatus]